MIYNNYLYIIIMRITNYYDNESSLNIIYNGYNSGYFICLWKILGFICIMYKIKLPNMDDRFDLSACVLTVTSKLNSFTVN